MTRAIRNYFVFLARCGRVAFVGDWRYYAWMGVLTVLALLGLNAYCKQFAHGLITTGMSDQVSWGVYISNFTFLVGVAARCNGAFAGMEPAAPAVRTLGTIAVTRRTT